jgi:hypothetical protein
MTTKQLIEFLSQFDPESTVVVTYPAWMAVANRVDTERIHVEELARYDGIHPLISANGAHLLED